MFGFEFLAADRLNIDQLLRTGQFALRIGHCRPCFGKIALSLFQRGTIGARIDHEKNIALADPPAFAKQDLRDGARYPRPHLDILHRLKSSDVVIPIDDDASDRHADCNGGLWWRRGRRRGTSGKRHRQNATHDPRVVPALIGD